MKTDFLVIGSGIAGLSYAYKVAMHFHERKEQIRVTIVTKVKEEESNTRYAQGGIAAVANSSDSFENHIEDTIVAGDGLCDEKVVRSIISEAPVRIQELIEWGTNFDKNKYGELDLVKEGGHSEHRILHHKDITGSEIERVLIAKVINHPYITILNYHIAIDLITHDHLEDNAGNLPQQNRCFGAYVLNRKKNEVVTLHSRITLLATGGVGQVYAYTTNPTVATGDGIAMAHRAKASIKDMEFVQFHPTALFRTNENPSFLISEAMRGAGGILRNKEGVEFMHNYDHRKDLAPRDIVARAIEAEMRISGSDYVQLDVTKVGFSTLKTCFPHIYKKCLTVGLNIIYDYIPVVPAAHYLCGGIEVNLQAETSIHGLYACGECSYTGLHGANRLASNSLMEALVYSHRAYLSGSKKLSSTPFQKNIPAWRNHGICTPDEDTLVFQTKQEIQQILSSNVGVFRSDEGLSKALRRLKILLKNSEQIYKRSKVSANICELRNLALVGYLITKSAMNRKNNVGAHYNVNHE